jgi:3-keto-disaccharide hydrolase
MSTSDHVESPYICPRCKAALLPDEATCYSCGFQLAHKRPERTPQPAQSYLAPSTGKDRSRKRNQAAFMYFMSAFLVIVLFAFLLFHAAGISFSTFFPHATATVPYPVPKENPLFSDSFFNDDYGWNLQSSPGNYAVTLGHDTLTLEIEQHKLLWELLPGERSYSDFTLTVNAMLSRGDQNNGYGVYIRGTANQASDLATYYRFELYGDGSYAIFKGTLDPGGHSTSTTIVDYTLSSVIQPHGKLNHLMVIARGAALSFIVNGQLLKTISDHSYASGSVALFVSNLSQAKPGAQVQFSQFAIYPVQA